MSRQETYSLQDLLYLMQRLRDPETGCPWDLEQNFASIAPYTLEEVYEVVDTLERADYAHLKEELGDLLFQVVFYAQLGKESGLFDFEAIVQVIVEKLVSRHPHVFPDGTLHSRREAGQLTSSLQVSDTWEELKKQERQEKGAASLLDDVPVALPALNRAAKLQKRAAKVKFDWQDAGEVLHKVDEELEELKQAVSADDREHIEEEMGDLLFVMVNLARHLSLNPETALRKATSKFEKRFRHMEVAVQKENRHLSDLTLEAQEDLWQQAKRST